MKISADREAILRIMSQGLTIEEIVDLARTENINRDERRAARFLLAMGKVEFPK